MGNTQSKKSDKSLVEIVNKIASKYITKQNFQDMKNLSKLEYCDKLIILTSNIINKYLDATEVKFLSQKKGVLGETMSRDKILAIDKDSLDNYDISDTVKKRRLCVGLAKHYVQVANIFAAISMTVNPKYNFVNENNDDKDELNNVEKHITRNSLCANRVAALLNNQNIHELEESYKSGKVTLNPDICTFNCSTCPTIKTINEEAGIPELEQLYYDKYDYDNGEFIGMTAKMNELYSNDVKNFYKTFTGNDSVPETISKFSDIKLKDYYDSPNCQNNIYNKPVTGKSYNPSFFNYIENIRSMLHAINKYHNGLLNILDQLFV